VWENMAQMCVKSHRIDVAKVCLGNMGNVKGIRLLNEEAVRGADSDTQVGLIALNLGMIVNYFFLVCKVFLIKNIK
jgi:intraflagellar transport protein 140